MLHFIQCVRMHIENTKSKVSRWLVLRSLKYSHDIILWLCSVYIIGWQSRTNQFFSLKCVQWIKHTNIFGIQSSKLQLQLLNWSFNQNSFRYHHALMIHAGNRDQWSKWKWHWFEHTGAEYFPWTSKHVSCTSFALTLPCKKCTVQPFQ